MAYIIGNTTVISNNAVLGSIDGNSLNLANNPNISGGGGVKTLNSSSNFPSSDLGSTGAVIVAVGGGGGDVQNRGGGLGSGGAEVFSLSPGGNVTANVGGGGNDNNGNPAYPAGGGGTSSLSYPGSQSMRAGGGNAALGENQGSNPGNPGAGFRMSSGTVYPNKSNRGVAGYSALFGS